MRPPEPIPLMRRAHSRPLALIPLLFLFAACDSSDPDGVTPPAHGEADVEVEDEAWATELIEHRVAIDEELRTSKTSPMAGTQYLKSEPMESVYLTRDGKIFGLADSPGPLSILWVARENESWRWYEQAPGITCSAGEEAVPSGGALETSVTFDLGDLFLRLHPSEDRVTFIVFDPDREEMKSFDHLLYFPPDRNYAVAARLVVLPDPDEIEMLTSRDLKKTFHRYAKIEFELDGEEHELSAFKSELTGDGSESLFVPFRDGTTGRTTYGAGRFLELEEPPQAQFTLDFNRAFNPLCNYSPAYNCAIPPRENHLDVAIEAGEMTYPR